MELNGYADMWSIIAPAEPEQLPEVCPAVLRRRPPVLRLTVVAVLGVGYLLLVNGYWHFQPDSAVYLTLGRNLAEGRGYVFNGVPHTKYPGGMGCYLAALMQVSRSFWWLNAVQCVTLLAGLGVLYLALGRVATRSTALLVVLLTGVAFWYHEYACSQMSEGPFILLSNSAVLLLLICRSGRTGWGRAVFLLLLCAAWAAAFWFRVLAAFWLVPFAAALLLEGRNNRNPRERIGSVVLICVVVVGAFGLYHAWARGGPAVPDGAHPTPYRPDWFGALALRLWRWPRWFSLLLCPPWAALRGMGVPDALVTAGDWLCLGVVLAGCWRALRRGQILVATAPLFLAPMALVGMGWKVTWGRYGVSILPLAILCFLMGLRELGELARRPRVRRALLWAGVLGVLLPNLAILAGNVVVQRKPDFYAHYRAGAWADLMGIMRYLQEQPAEERIGTPDTAVLQALPFAGGTSCRRVLWQPRGGWDDNPEGLVALARREGLTYLVTKDWAQPWPVWHVPPRWTGRGERDGPYHLLWRYVREEGRIETVPVPASRRWPRRVPGMSGRSKEAPSPARASGRGCICRARSLR